MFAKLSVSMFVGRYYGEVYCSVWIAHCIWDVYWMWCIEYNVVFDCCQVAVAGLWALANIAVDADNVIALRPHIGVIVSLLQEHSSDSEVM